jgi:hypothetical protein
MKAILSLLAGLAGALSLPANAVTVVTFNGGSGVIPVGMLVFQGFESLATGAALGANAFVFSSSVSGEAARPAFGSSGKFGAVLTNGSYTASFGPTNAFSFVLGSIDNYNALRLRYEDGSTQIYSGGQIINDLSFPSGDQISGQTNGVVTYSVTSGPRLTGATFTSSGNSFEFDNLAIAVPEPATWMMILGGFGFVGVAVRRRKRIVSVEA